MQAVPELDLERYLGRWYEIARLPNWFEGRCVTDVTATYSREEGGAIRVANACRNADGSAQGAVGAARLADPNGSPSKLQVRFAPAYLEFLPFVWANYWVIDLDPDYQWAVVGEPNRKFLWILSRTPQMNDATYDDLVRRIEAHGYNVTDLIRTAQP